MVAATTSPLDHATGAGWVKPRRGDYEDAIVRKRTRVCMMLVEATGGVVLGGRKALGALAERAGGRNAVDRTVYGAARDSPTSYYTHHVQQLVKAAVVTDAQAIRRQVIGLRQRVCTSAAEAAAAHGARA